MPKVSEPTLKPPAARLALNDVTEALMRGVVSCQVLKAIYDTLNENDIEIPFPQQDVHIRS